MDDRTTGDAGVTAEAARTRPVTWGLAGVSMVTLAVALAVVGIALALQQAQSVGIRLLGQSQLLARQIAHAAEHNYEWAERITLGETARRYCENTEENWRASWALPPWIDGLYVYHEPAIETLIPASVPYSARLLTDRVAEHVKSTGLGSPIDQSGGVRMTLEEEGRSSAMLFAAIRCPPEDHLILIVGLAPLSDLAKNLVGPLIPPDGGLELASLAQADRPWAQTLPWPMHDWVIQPTAAFMGSQRTTVLRHTLVYVGLTALALATLLGAMWFLLRVMRREVSLAELKSNFVADVSHELKTPLAMIRLFAETLQSGRVTDEQKCREYYEIIARESTRLTNLINNILDFARIEAGRKAYSFQATNVGEVIRRTYETYRAELEHLHFKHHLSVADGLPQVEADRDAITQVLVNLISNVMKYSGDDRFLAIHVEADTRRGRRGVLISVEDRGIGIRPEDRARVFEGFFRAPDGRVQGQGGTGLGLALVKQIVDAHGGSIDVESRLVKGTAFRVFLPAAGEKA